jgi:hypothetical protein
MKTAGFISLGEGVGRNTNSRSSAMEWIPYQGMESPVTVGHIVTGPSHTGQHRSTDGDRLPGKADKTTTFVPIPWDDGVNSHQQRKPDERRLSKPVRGPIIPAGNVAE